jgi:hypothetical protein
VELVAVSGALLEEITLGPFDVPSVVRRPDVFRLTKSLHVVCVVCSFDRF